MISQLLLYKILQLFIIMIIGCILVKIKLVKSDDISVLSKLSLYLFMPAVIINAFNVEITNDVVLGLTIAFFLAILVHIVLLLIDYAMKKCFRATNVERASIMYSNAGNLIIPIVTYILGEEWLIYSSAFIIVQLTFMWTHGIRLFSDGKISLKKILLNPNMIAVFIGFAVMLTGLRFPPFVGEITSSLASMLAPVGMIIAGMLAADLNFGNMFKNKRLYLVLIARLIICPVIIMLLFKGILPCFQLADIRTIMLISYLASITPTATTIVQLAQLYGKDSYYATAINVFTTIVCLVTMPLLIWFF